jgi:hypothetical protein
LRKLGHLSSGYIDDSYLQGDSYEDCVNNVIDTVTLFDSLGFIVHPTKSVFNPTQRLVFLWFILDSVKMKVYPTPDKAKKLAELCANICTKANPTIREVSQVLGYMASSFPGAMYGPLHVRHIEKQKILALQHNKGNFDSHMTLDTQCSTEFKWWENNITTSFNVISHGEPSMVSYFIVSLLS